ncbi:MAG: radical SAM protein [Deltaproteobacteria bacterium]|nr:radical SAM protein [Deltaproteobacteria bacterium]
MIALQAVTPQQLLERVPGCTLDEARKIVAAVHRDEDVLAPRSGVSRKTREALQQSAHVPALATKEERRSALDPFVKFALQTADEKTIETVRIPLENQNRFSACVSSQIGCALACAFCATGRLGLIRNLEAWEIVEQVRIVRRTLVPGQRVHGVVFQGMGEPMANLDRVLQAIAVLSDPCGPQIDGRNITVCTSGLTPGILRLANEAPRVRLGLSFGSAQSGVRKTIMPIERAHALDEVLAAAAEHALKTKLAPMWAVTLLEGVNDSHDDARALAARAKDFVAKTGKKPRISVIAYNAIDKDSFERVSEDKERVFRQALHDKGFPTHRRYSGGSDVGAACGQLAGAAAQML